MKCVRLLPMSSIKVPMGFDGESTYSNWLLVLRSFIYLLAIVPIIYFSFAGIG